MNPRELSNEELAEILWTMIITGISPSPYEKECLKEAATRLVEGSIKDDGNTL